ncbi:MAG: rRNA maturation RNase YbeY [Candidatus Dojkabacteria bacterium]|nr:MAG: rRNA maturation RNase YbeY [Candidatus Dojkabacteria bacterium]
MKFEILGLAKDQLESSFGVKEEQFAKMLSEVVESKFAKQKNLVNIVFVDEEEMQRINRENRDTDSSTDVLAFNMPEGSDVFGEVYISLEDVRKNVVDNGVSSVKEECIRMIMHGILHLFGYQHEDYFDENRDDLEIMYRMQEDMLGEFMEKLPK